MNKLFLLTLIILVTTVPMAPSAIASPPQSGLQKGESVEPWNPIHVAGPDRGTNTCPVCSYLERPVVVIFAKDSVETIKLAMRLEKLVATHQKNELKGVLTVLD